MIRDFDLNQIFNDIDLGLYTFKIKIVILELLGVLLKNSL